MSKAHIWALISLFIFFSCTLLSGSSALSSDLEDDIFVTTTIKHQHNILSNANNNNNNYDDKIIIQNNNLQEDPTKPSENRLNILNYVLQAGSQEGSLHTYFDGHFKCSPMDCTPTMTFDFYGVNPTSLNPPEPYPLPPPAMLVIYFYSFKDSETVFQSQSNVWKMNDYNRNNIKPFSTKTDYDPFLVEKNDYVGFYGEITYTNGSSIQILDDLPQLTVIFNFTLTKRNSLGQDDNSFEILPTNDDLALNSALLYDISQHGNNNIWNFRQKYFNKNPKRQPYLPHHHHNHQPSKQLATMNSVHPDNTATHYTTSHLQRTLQGMISQKVSRYNNSNIQVINGNNNNNNNNNNNGLTNNIDATYIQLTSNTVSFSRTIYSGDRYSLYMDGILLRDDHYEKGNDEYIVNIRVSHTKASFTAFYMTLIGPAKFPHQLQWVDCTSAYGGIDFQFQIYTLGEREAVGYFEGGLDSTYVISCPYFIYLKGKFTKAIASSLQIFNHTSIKELQDYIENKKLNAMTTALFNGQPFHPEYDFVQLNSENDPILADLIKRNGESARHAMTGNNNNNNNNNNVDTIMLKTCDLNLNQLNSINNNTYNLCDDPEPTPTRTYSSISRITTTSQLQSRIQLNRYDTTSVPNPLILLEPPKGYAIMRRAGIEDGSSWMLSSVTCRFNVYFNTQNEPRPKETQKTVLNSKEKFKISLINALLIDDAYITITKIDGTLLARWTTDRNIYGTDIDPYILYESFYIHHDLDTIMESHYFINVFAPLVNSTSDSNAKKIQCQMFYEVADRPFVNNIEQEEDNNNNNNDIIHTNTIVIDAQINEIDNTNSSNNTMDDDYVNTIDNQNVMTNRVNIDLLPKHHLIDAHGAVKQFKPHHHHHTHHKPPHHQFMTQNNNTQHHHHHHHHHHHDKSLHPHPHHTNMMKYTNDKSIVSDYYKGNMLMNNNDDINELQAQSLHTTFYALSRAVVLNYMSLQEGRLFDIPPVPIDYLSDVTKQTEEVNNDDNNENYFTIQNSEKQQKYFDKPCNLFCLYQKHFIMPFKHLLSTRGAGYITNNQPDYYEYLSIDEQHEENYIQQQLLLTSPSPSLSTTTTSNLFKKYPTEDIFKLKPITTWNTTFYKASFSFPPLIREASEFYVQFTTFNYRFFINNETVTDPELQKQCYLNGKLVYYITDLDDKVVWKDGDRYFVSLRFQTSIFSGTPVVIDCPALWIESQVLTSKHNKYPHRPSDFLFPETSNILRVVGTNTDSHNVKHKYAQLVPFRYFKIKEVSYTVVYLTLIVIILICVILLFFTIRCWFCPWLRKRQSGTSRRAMLKKKRHRAQASALDRDNNLNNNPDYFNTLMSSNNGGGSSGGHNMNGARASSNVNNPNSNDDENFFITLNEGNNGGHVGGGYHYEEF